MSPRTDTNSATPVPYQPGNSLQLQVLNNFHDPPLPQSLTATILNTLSITMSSVIAVTIDTNLVTQTPAILKLYDRRFGTDLRDFLGTHVPHTAARETAFQSFIQTGQIEPFLRELDEEDKSELLPRAAWSFLDKEETADDNEAKYEAALWRQCSEYFDCETGAYERLRDLQGKAVPRMYAHVRLVVPGADISLALQESSMAKYFEVRGVLLEHIPGYELRDLGTSPLAPSNTEDYAPIIQAAVDAAHEINARGVLMNDCQPRNVVVDMRSQNPFIIDLAQCYFKDRLIEAWREMGWFEDDDEEQEGSEEAWDPDVEFWERVMGSDNPGAIGAVMAGKLRRAKGMELDIKYPDCKKIIENVKRRKAAGLGKEGILPKVVEGHA